MVLAAATVFAADQKILDIRPAASNDAVPTGVEWENAHDAELAAETAPEKLSSFVADADAAKALLAQVKPAYATDSLVARQIAAVSQWVMLSDPWYCLFWDGAHAAGRKVWVEALLTRTETASDDYVKVFCLDQLRWCGYDCPALVARIRAIEEASGSKAVKEFAAMLVRELTKSPSQIRGN